VTPTSQPVSFASHISFFLPATWPPPSSGNLSFNALSFFPPLLTADGRPLQVRPVHLERFGSLKFSPFYGSLPPSHPFKMNHPLSANDVSPNFIFYNQCHRAKIAVFPEVPTLFHRLPGVESFFFSPFRLDKHTSSLVTQSRQVAPGPRKTTPSFERIRKKEALKILFHALFHPF